MLLHLTSKQRYTFAGRVLTAVDQCQYLSREGAEVLGIGAHHNPGVCYASDVLIFLKMVFRPEVRLLMATIAPREIKDMRRAYSTRS
jgi:hypothetical protein